MQRSIFFALALALAACSKPLDPPHAMLDHFVDAYVRHADPVMARQYASGDALTRLDGEIAAVAGQERPASGPDVEFKVTQEQLREDSATFELELNIRASEGAGFTRDLMITGAKIQGEWKVVDYLFLK